MIFGSRLRQAREFHGLTQAKLAELVQRDQSLIAYIENGVKQPGEELLEAIAQHTNFPVSFFSQPPETELPFGSLLFRAHTGLTRREAVEAHRFAEVAFFLGAHLAYIVELPSVSLPTRSDESPQYAARHTRASLGLSPDTPVPRLIRNLEKAGVWVLPIPRLEGRDAFCSWASFSERDTPIIAISTGRPGDRLRYSIAHELGHLVMHKKLPFKPVAEIEKDADAFAAEFLMPASTMNRELLPPVTLTTVARLKPKWGVSMQSLIVRAKQLNLISERQYRYLFQQLSARGWREAEPSNLDVPIEKPRLIAKMAEVAYGMPLKYAKIASALHVPESEIRNIFFHFAHKEEVADDRVVGAKVIRFSKHRK